ncbi:MAG: energy-coupling factor transporter ATPase [Dethiobacter sp.]|jgi:energy-coupling factor transport system ATP-binding protein|nr:energy-coupling factor transporter ATPase [Dethiobacter sp.]
MSIKVIGLNHRYKAGTPFEKQALFEINLEIEAGEFLGLIGPSQAGKTTLAQYFNALHLPAQGRVLINGQDTGNRKTDLTAIRRSVGYVFQNPDCQLFKPTVGEDIAFGPANQRCSRAEISERVRESMATVGLDYGIYHKRNIFALSGGQKRRAAIAGVLACRPQTLILDDITAGLDPQGREEILEVVGKLHRDKKMTVVFISSNMDDLSRLAKRIVVMHRGKIVMDGAAREIFACVQQLKHLCLQPPQIMDIIYRLKQRGFSVPLSALTLEEALEIICAALKQRGAG